MQRKYLIAAALGIATTVAAGTARADVIAYSGFSITNAQFFWGDSSSTTQVSIFDIAPTPTPTISTTVSATAQLNGVSSNPASASAGTLAPTVLDTLMACVGNCAGIAQNDFSPTHGTQAASYSRGDAYLTGSVVDNPLVPGTESITAHAVAEGRIIGDAFGSSFGSTGNFSTFALAVPDGVTELTLKFDVDLDLFASVDVNNAGGATAYTTFSVLLSKTTAPTFFQAYQPTDLNNLISADSSSSPVSYSVSGTYMNTFTGLASGRYTLTIGHTANQLTTSVPEPTTLALLGVGLTVLGVARIRRRRAA